MDTKKPKPKDAKPEVKDQPEAEKEFGGFEKRLEPTRYGDWEVKGRCSDF